MMIGDIGLETTMTMLKAFFRIRSLRRSGVSIRAKAKAEKRDRRGGVLLKV